MARSYQDYIATGQMSRKEAAQQQALRDTARDMASRTIAGGEVVAAPVAFGMLDVIAVKLVGWYGAEAAAEVFKHYGGVCARQKGG